MTTSGMHRRPFQGRHLVIIAHGHDRVWPQFELGHEYTWAQSCMGTIVYAQSFLGTIMSGDIMHNCNIHYKIGMRCRFIMHFKYIYIYFFAFK